MQRALATVHLALDDPGLGVMLAEALQSSAHAVSWHGAAPENVPDVVVLDGDPNGDVARVVEVWRRHDPPPAVVLLGSTQAAMRAAERLRLPFVPKPIDVKSFVSTTSSAGKLRFVTAYTPAAALAAVGMRAREDELENASAVIGGSRMIDPMLVRAALRPHALEYVTPTPFLGKLREERALTVPEANLAMRLDGAATLKSVIDSGTMEAASAARLLWALASVHAIAFLSEPHPDGRHPRIRATLRARIHLRARKSRCEKAILYDVLEVAPDPDPEEVDRACQLLAVWYSPKRLAGLDLGDLAPLVDPLWQQIVQARDALGKIDNRMAYEQWLLGRGISLERRRDEWDRNTREGEEAFLAGQKALGLGDVVKAMSTLAKAARLKPDEPDYECYAAWARVLAEELHGTERRAAAARERPGAERTLAGRRPRPRALVAIGLLCEAAGDVLAAREAFQDALDCEPRLQLARRALERLGLPDAKPQV
jgi:hypothetical protein